MWIITVVAAALWAFFALVLPSSNINEDDLLQQTFEKSIFLFHNALLFGYAISLSGTGYHTFISGSVYDPEVTYTLTNIPQWSGWAKFFLGVSAFTVLFLIVTNLLLRRSMGIFARSVLSAAMVFLIGYWIGKIVPFLYSNSLLYLLTIPLGLIEAILLAMYPISAILFLLPTSMIATMNRVREENERKSRPGRTAAAAAAAEAAANKEAADREAWHSAQFMPPVITGPYGHTYRRVSGSAFSAEYISDHDSSSVTIHDSDISADGSSAMVDGGYYHW